MWNNEKTCSKARLDPQAADQAPYLMPNLERPVLEKNSTGIGTGIIYLLYQLGTGGRTQKAQPVLV